MTVELPGRKDFQAATPAEPQDDPLSFTPPPAPPASEEPAPSEPEVDPLAQIAQVVGSAGERDYDAELSQFINAPPIQDAARYQEGPKDFKFENPDLNNVMGQFHAHNSFAKKQVSGLENQRGADTEGKNLEEFSTEREDLQKATSFKEEHTSYLDKALGWMTDYKGPLAPDAEAGDTARTYISQIWRGGQELADAGLVGGEFDKGMFTGYFGMKEMVGGGLTHLGKFLQRWDPDELDMWIGQHLIDAGEKLTKEGHAINTNPILASRVPTWEHISGENWFRDTVDYIAAKSGQGVGNMGAIAAFYASGGVLAGTGFLTTISMGEVRNELIEEGITNEDDLQKYATAAGLVIASLERVFPGGLAKQMKATVKKKITRHIIKRIAKGGAKGALTEGITEGFQEAVQIAAVANAKGAKEIYDLEPMWDIVYNRGGWRRVLDATISGALPGGMFGSYGTAVETGAQIDAAAQRGKAFLQPTQMQIARARAARKTLTDESPEGAAAPDAAKTEPEVEPIQIDPDIERQEQKMEDLRRQAIGAGALEAPPTEAVTEAAPQPIAPQGQEDAVQAMDELAAQRDAQLAEQAQPAAPFEWDRTTISSGAKLPENMEVIEVDPAAVGANMDTGQYFPQSRQELEQTAATEGDYNQDPAQQMLQRQERLRTFAQEKTRNEGRVSLPEIGLTDNGKVHFTNGRNRFMLARDAGATSIPVAVTREQAAQMRQLGLTVEASPQQSAAGKQGAPASPRERARTQIQADDARRVDWTKFAAQARKDSNLDLEGLDVDITFTNEEGNAETVKVPAKRALGLIDQRMKGIAQLVRCLG